MNTTNKIKAGEHYWVISHEGALYYIRGPKAVAQRFRNNKGRDATLRLASPREKKDKNCYAQN